MDRSNAEGFLSKHRLHKNILPYQRKLLALFILAIVVIAAYMMWGLTAKNIGYHVPRRAIKLLAVIVVSYAIGYSSVVFQTITNNTILTPSVMGLDSLYMFIQTAVVYFFGNREMQLMSGFMNFVLSVAFMVAASSLLYALLFQKESKNVYLVILSGMVLGQLFGGLSTFMQVVMDPNEFLSLQGKMFASFNNINSDLLWISLVVVVSIIVLTWCQMPQLDALSLGPDHAINLGVHYSQMVKWMFLLIAILVSIATVLVGPVMFLGILVVSLSRKLLITYKHTYRIAGAGLLGVIFLIGAMILVERLFSFETTVSVIVNFAGGAYFLYLMIKERSI